MVIKVSNWSDQEEQARFNTPSLLTFPASQSKTMQEKNMTTNNSTLFSKTSIGPIELEHRVVMAPLTRLRSEMPGDIPGALMLEYYAQRASQGGLIISEAATISSTARGYYGAPGIYSKDQVAGWRRITDAIHAKGGRIFLQLWHVGRTSHVDISGGAIPVGPSVVPYEGVAFTPGGWVPVTPNRALEVSEIPALLDDYTRAAQNAADAGFDGVELHSGNGYLLDQFLQDGSNQRTDEYGGSPENRARLLLQVVEAVAKVWDRSRIGVRISPATKFNGMSDSNPEATSTYVAQQLERAGIAFIHIIEPRINGSQAVKDGLPPVAAALIRKHFTRTIIAAGGFEADTAEEIIQSGDADLVAFGRHFIANPDLPLRYKLGVPLNPYDRSTFYGGTEKGYTDYPAYEEVAAV
jgi:N-ethylmaleimide reductase